MEIKELKDMLLQSVESNRSRYIPWWEADFEHVTYKYDIYKEEEIQAAEACIRECTAEELSEGIGREGYTLFHLLVWLGFYDAVEIILKENKVEVDLTDHKGRGITPLLLACSRGNLRMIQLLIGYGADSALCDAMGRNGYHYLACVRPEGLTNYHTCLVNSMGQRREASGLLSADINGQDKGGMTPLVLLLHRDDSNCSSVLTDVFLERGAKMDYVDEDGNTLLMTAIKKRHMTAALRLMEYPELVNQPDKDGKTPMQCAENSYNEGICMALKDHGATPSSGITRMDMNNLSRITSNAFAGVSKENMDHLGPALYLARTLIRQIDPDDDDDMRCITNIFYSALMNDEKCQVLDMCQEAGIGFTDVFSEGGSTTCLRDKCFSGNSGIKAIQKLVELGVDMDEAVVMGKTPANIVASLQKRNMMFGEKEDYQEKAAQFFSKESMEQTDNTGTTAVHAAARNDHIDMLKIMIEKGVDVNITEDAPAESGSTPLHSACIYGNGEVAKLLMDAGADDTLANVNGETPAHVAVMKKKFGGDLTAQQRESVLRELENLDSPRNDGQTPLMVLQYLDLNSSMDLLPVFLDRGVDVNHRDNNGNTALIHNTYNQCFKGIVKELVRAGADVNAANKDGNTALHYALRYGSQDVARFLVKKGADYNFANNQGVTPAQLAVEKGYDNVLELMSDISL